MIRKVLLVLSIALLAAISGLWISSYWYAYECTYRRPGVVSLSLIYGAGYARFEFAPWPPLPFRPIRWKVERIYPPSGRSRYDDVPGFLPLHFSYWTGLYYPGLTVAMPFWLVFSLFGSFPVWITLRRRIGKSHRRRRLGLCITCGYDLTGNKSGVCPECGTKIENPPEQREPS